MQAEQPGSAAELAFATSSSIVVNKGLSVTAPEIKKFSVEKKRLTPKY
jgi:hypothetical protein